MPKEKVVYFWNIKGEQFAGCSFGEDVTKYFADDEERLKKYVDLGKIVTEEPLDFDHAKENELSSLRIEVEKLQSRNSELEAESEKSGTVKLKEARAEIAELKEQLEEATAPKDK